MAEGQAALAPSVGGGQANGCPSGSVSTTQDAPPGWNPGRPAPSATARATRPGPRGPRSTSTRLELAHRRTLAAADSGDVAHGLAEELLALVATTVRRTVPGPTPAADAAGCSPVGRARDAAMVNAAMVNAAREAIAAGHPAADGLFPLADLLEVSPYRLSRGFSRETGMSLTH